MDNYIINGACSCNQWQVKGSVSKPLADLNPRICDCDYCQYYPAAIISDPTLVAEFIGGTSKVEKNGDQLANFYYCHNCNDLLAVGCKLDSQLRGAVNINLLKSNDQFGEPVSIQPRLLGAAEKKDRWGKLWGKLTGLSQ